MVFPKKVSFGQNKDSINTVSRLLGKAKQNSSVEKKLKTKLHARYVFTVLCFVLEFSKQFKVDIISFCIVLSVYFVLSVSRSCDFERTVSDDNLV